MSNHAKNATFYYRSVILGRNGDSSPQAFEALPRNDVSRFCGLGTWPDRVSCSQNALEGL